MSSVSLSIIIPTLNEAENLPLLLSQLLGQRDIDLEIIVVDGGSVDATIEVAKQKGVKVIEGEKGRAKQLNAGAKKAHNNLFLFLHADSGISSENSLADAVKAFLARDERNAAGHFALNFDQQTDKNRWAFRYLEEKTRSNRLYTINGDQGFLISRQFFSRLGGYDEELLIMEDQEFAQKVFEEGVWILLPGTLSTSGRRFEREGFHRRYILMSLMMGLYWTDAHEFFRRAKNVYVEQKDAERLKLWPFFRCVWQMLYRDYGFKKSLLQWYKVGRYVRQNSWQLFFFIDVLLRKKSDVRSYPMTRFHDRYFYPITNNVVGNVLLTPVIFIWYMLVLGPYFFITDS